LLAGASGFLGTALLGALDADVTVALRGRDFDRRAQTLGRRADRHLRAARVDITQDLWGLEASLGELRDRVSVVVNAAATTDWAAPEARLSATNVGGARNGVDVAAALGVPLVHVSSLYAGYTVEGTVPEELLVETPVLSRYERSKCRGEWAVADRAAQINVPVVIARVGGLSGDVNAPAGQRSSAGRVPFARLFQGLGTTIVPFAGGARVELNPRDLVARAIADLAMSPPVAGVAVRNIGFGSSAPTLAAVFEEIAAILRQKDGRRLRLVRLPASSLLRASTLADRFGSTPRAAVAIGLRYLASSAVYEGGGIAGVSLSELVRSLGLSRPSASTPPAYYRDWVA